METNNSLKENELSKLIVKMTTTGKSELNLTHCKELKNLCKNSNEIVEEAFQKLWSQLKKPHSEIRLSCVQIIDILFMRSSHFRSLIIDQFCEYFVLTMGTETKLPPPIPVSNQVKIQSIKCFKKWNETFSPAYKQIDLSRKYLEEVKNIKFENVEENVLFGDDEGIRSVRLARAVDEMEAVTEDIQMSIQELKHCLNLILPSPEEFDLFCKDNHSCEMSIKTALEATSDENEDSGDDEDYYEDVDYGDLEDVSRRNKNDNYNKLHALSNNTISLVFNKLDKIKIYEDSDNADLIVTLREKFELLKKKYLVFVRQTLRLYSKYRADSNLVRTVAELKCEIQNVIDKADKLLIIRKDAEEEEDDDFVEVPSIKPTNNEISQLLELASSSSLTKSTICKPGDNIDSSSLKTESSLNGALDYNSKPWSLGDPLLSQQAGEEGANKTRVGATLKSASGRDYWRDPVFDKKLSEAIGIDLTSDGMRRRKKRGGLTDLRRIHKDTAKKRLIKILSKKKEKKEKENLYSY